MTPFVRFLLVVAALVCLGVFTLEAFDVWPWSVVHVFGWLGAGLFLFVLAGLPWPVPPRRAPQ